MIGTRCLDDECDWGPLGTDDPSTWEIVEQFRLDHETETGHQTTVETVRQRTILANSLDGMEFAEFLIDDVADDRIEWVCPECDRTAEEMDATKRCPSCDEPFREVLP